LEKSFWNGWCPRVGEAKTTRASFFSRLFYSGADIGGPFNFILLSLPTSIYFLKTFVFLSPSKFD
jgi:hypothetical protein